MFNQGSGEQSQTELNSDIASRKLRSNDIETTDSPKQYELDSRSKNLNYEMIKRIDIGSHHNNSNQTESAMGFINFNDHSERNINMATTLNSFSTEHNSSKNSLDPRQLQDFGILTGYSNMARGFMSPQNQPTSHKVDVYKTVMQHVRLRDYFLKQQIIRKSPEIFDRDTNKFMQEKDILRLSERHFKRIKEYQKSMRPKPVLHTKNLDIVRVDNRSLRRSVDIPDIKEYLSPKAKFQIEQK